MYSLPFAIFLMYQTTSSFQEQAAFDMNKIVISDTCTRKDNSFVITDKLMRNLERLNDIARLESNWDGYGAVSFSDELVAEVRHIILNLREQPEIFPTGRESIQLEYHLPDESYLEFEVFKGHIAVMQVEQTDYDNAQFWDFTSVDTWQIQQIVAKFLNA